MFRQTLIRACLKRNLQCGASNDKQQKNRVTFTMSGEKQKIDEITDFMKSGKEMNDWGARCETLNQLDSGKKIEEHQVVCVSHVCVCLFVFEFVSICLYSLLFMDFKIYCFFYFFSHFLKKDDGKC